MAHENCKKHARLMQAMCQRALYLQDVCNWYKYSIISRNMLDLYKQRERYLQDVCKQYMYSIYTIHILCACMHFLHV